MIAVGTKPPLARGDLFLAVTLHVDLINQHVMSMRIEGRTRHEFCQAGGRRTGNLNLLILRRFRLYLPAPENRLQGDAWLGEGIVRQQAHTITQPSHHRLFLEIGDEGAVALDLDLQRQETLGSQFLRQARILLHLVTQFAEIPLLLVVVLQRGPSGHHRRLQPTANALLAVDVRIGEGQKRRARRRMHSPQPRLKTLHEVSAILIVPGEERLGKCRLRALVNRLEHASDRIRQARLSRREHPLTQGKAQILAFKDRIGIKEHAWRRDRARDHLRRITEEIQVMRSRRGHGDVECAAVLTSRTSDSLDELGLVRRHAAQEHTRQVADVHAHLQSRRRRNEVRIPLLRPLGLKPVLQFLALITIEQSRMLRRIDPVNLAMQVLFMERIAQHLLRSRLRMPNDRQQINRKMPVRQHVMVDKATDQSVLLKCGEEHGKRFLVQVEARFPKRLRQRMPRRKRINDLETPQRLLLRIRGNRDVRRDLGSVNLNAAMLQTVDRKHLATCQCTDAQNAVPVVKRPVADHSLRQKLQALAHLLRRMRENTQRLRFIADGIRQSRPHRVLKGRQLGLQNGHARSLERTPEILPAAEFHRHLPAEPREKGRQDLLVWRRRIVSFELTPGIEPLQVLRNQFGQLITGIREP